MTGYDTTGWDASTRILHAVYKNPSLTGPGTHDDLHRRRLIAGDTAPVIIGEVDLDEATTVTGTQLGFVIRPGKPWRRVRWTESLARTPDGAMRMLCTPDPRPALTLRDHKVPPSRPTKAGENPRFRIA
jgi:hypothetical protein